MRFKDGKDHMTLVYLRKPIIIPGRNTSLAGYVKSKLFSQPISLIVDHRQQDNTTYKHACASLRSDGTVCILMEPELYLDFVRGKAYARTTILHELGHVFYNDLPDIQRDGTEYDAERLSSIESGNVHVRELRADEFAARFIGAYTVSQGLLFLQNVDIAEKEELNTPSIQELEKRIQALAVSGQAALLGKSRTDHDLLPS